MLIVYSCGWSLDIQSLLMHSKLHKHLIPFILLKKTNKSFLMRMLAIIKECITYFKFIHRLSKLQNRWLSFYLMKICLRVEHSI